MKNIIIPTGLFILFLLVFNSCEQRNIENDARKIALLQCEALQLMKKAAEGDSLSFIESEKISQKAETLLRKMEKKYTSENEFHEFEKILQRELSNCN